MTGKTGHKVVVDINLTSVDIKEDDDKMTDDDNMTSENEEELPGEMDTFSNSGKKRCRKQSKVELADRPVRERKKKQQFHWSNLGWNHREKQKLLEALKKYPPSAIDQIQAMVSSKTKTQIKDYLNKINKSINWKSDDPMPIVDWTNMARDLVRTEKRDYTDSLSRTMSIISNFEDHPKPAERVPDYKTIYRYLAQVLDGKELPLLGPLESAVMLDLLHGVINKIEKSETTRQRQVMKWKYQLLSGKVDTTKLHLFIKKARKALSNDFSDFEDEKMTFKQEPGTQSSETRQSNTQPGQQQSAVPAGRKTTATATSAQSSTAVDSRKRLTINETTVISNSMDKLNSPVPSGSKGPLKVRRKSSKLSIRPETDMNVSKNRPVNVDETEGECVSSDKNKNTTRRGIMESKPQKRQGGDNGKTLGPEEEGITKCPPTKRRRRSNVDIETQPHPDSEVVKLGTGGDLEQRKMSFSTDGQNKTATTSEKNQTLSTNQNKSEDQTSNQSKGPSREKKQRGVGRPPKGIYKVQEDRVELLKASEQMYGRRSGRPVGTRKVIPERPEKVPEDPTEIPKKPSLYTLNPFCVPVSLLPLRNKPVSKHVTTAQNQVLLPAIVSKKHGPLFNKQRNEGITSVSIHRMAAIIPVSKQHVLLPNSASQKSQT
ncbi:uncharacterized protein LOC117341047 [Pecten maximus]|uniref:uncharacterized protein LOC117341047 n=1 Tax=Pecten maximus TaxID=6579 RepID=UPI001458334E|nr:uncharacterized protein LOC117341047 [Pecten maximus]